MVLDDLQARGLVHDTTDIDALRRDLDGGSIRLYHGIDPTAASMHIGNYVGVLALRRFQDAGHHPYVLVGGSTGMIGDPGGRSEERNLLDEEALHHNIEGLRGQLEKLVDFERATLVSNYEWTKDVGVLDFLRDVGKHVTVNQMVARDSVRSRMESTHGISYTEFSYMLLQAYDYWWLHEHHEVTLQIGGSDQWGNIAQGVDLIRRRSSAHVHALTWPLITRSDGQKFGKSVDGAVWLDPALTSPYQFHQYWLQVADDDVERFLLQLTLLSVEDVGEVMASHAVHPERREAQSLLADTATELVHGSDEVRRARRAADVLFGGDAPSADDLEALRGIVPEADFDSAGDDLVVEPLVAVLIGTGLATSKRDARQSIADGAVRWNGERVDAVTKDQVGAGTIAMIQRGKKRRHLAVFR